MKPSENEQYNQKWLDDAISKAIGSQAPQPNFAKWQQAHPAAVETLKSYADQADNSSQLARHNIWRTIMKTRITKLTTAAAIVIVASVAIISLTSSTPAYALEQTIEALRKVRFLHMVKHDDQGQLKDERWIEIGPDGFQARYRQDTPPTFFVVDDRKTVLAHHKDKNTVVLYDAKDQSYQWIGNLGQFFKDLQGTPGSVTIEENIEYRGKLAHQVRWLKLGQDCYIDPQTKLPIAMMGYQITYEDPPDGTFEIVIPDGVTLVDKRPGAAPSQEPQWMKQKMTAGTQFAAARHALASGEYSTAIELFKEIVEIEPGRNWAWFWLAQAHYELDQHDAAIQAYSKVIDMMDGPAACHLARGLAYAKKGMESRANNDISKALPSMILALRHIEGTTMFDYADDPRSRGGNKPNKEQSLAMMINRLRITTGQNFGYDPAATPAQTEQVIAAWEQWLESSGQVQVDFEAELVSVPRSPEPSDAEKQLAKLANKIMDMIKEMMATPTNAPGQQALELFGQAKESKLADVPCWLGLGVALYEGRHYTEALEAFRRVSVSAEKHPPLDFICLAWQGIVLDLLDRHEQAVQCYRQALEKYPGQPIPIDTHGTKIDRQWLEERLEKPFERFERK